MLGRYDARHRTRHYGRRVIDTMLGGDICSNYVEETLLHDALQAHPAWGGTTPGRLGYVSQKPGLCGSSVYGGRPEHVACDD